MRERRFSWPVLSFGCALAVGTMVSPSEAIPQEDFCPSTDYRPVPEQWFGTDAVRPVFPQSGAWLDHSLVTFTWWPAVPAIVELSRSRHFIAVEQTATGVGSVSPPPLPAGTWFWRVRTEGLAQASTSWSLQIAPKASLTHRGVGLSVGVDFDGDGLDDTIAPRDIHFGSRYGEIGHGYLDFATVWATHHDACPVRNWGAAPPDPKCGTITNSWPVGDVDGDGHGDVVSIDFEKNLYLYLGRDTLDIPRNITPSRLLRSGDLAIARDTSVSKARAGSKISGRGPGTHQTMVHGDFNGDGYSDFLDGWYAYYGAGDYRQIEMVALDRSFPVGMASGCDVNSDGFVDVATLSAKGQLDVFMGSAAGLGRSPYLTMRWTTVDALASVEEATANPVQLIDVDGDGFCDVISLFPIMSQPEFAELLVLSGRAIRDRAPKVQRYRWRRAAAKGSLSWVVVPKAYNDEIAMVLAYDTAPFSFEFRRAVFEPGRALRQDRFLPRLLGELEEISYRYDLYIRGDETGDGRLDIANNDIQHSFYGGSLGTVLGDGNGTFEPKGGLMWGGPEQGFFVYFRDAQ